MAAVTGIVSVCHAESISDGVVNLFDRVASPNEISPQALKEVKDFFAEGGCDIRVKEAGLFGDNTGVIGGSLSSPSLLVLSSDVKAALEKGRGESGVLKITKDEAWAILRHERKHLENEDNIRRIKELGTWGSSVLLATRAAYVRRGRWAAGVTLLGSYPIGFLIFAQLGRRKEKRCDLSMVTSSQAQDLSRVFEKAQELEAAAGSKSLFKKWYEKVFATHPSLSERIRYLKEHASNLLVKEAPEEVKKIIQKQIQYIKEQGPEQYIRLAFSESDRRAFQSLAQVMEDDRVSKERKAHIALELEELECDLMMAVLEAAGQMPEVKKSNYSLPTREELRAIIREGKQIAEKITVKK